MSDSADMAFPGQPSFPLRPEAAVPSALDRRLLQHEAGCLYLRAVDVRSEEHAQSYCDCLTSEAVGELAALRQRCADLEAALREATEHIQAFATWGPGEKDRKALLWKLRKALGGDDART